MTGDEELKLKFWQWFVYQGGGHDYGVVQISVYDPEAATWSGWGDLSYAAIEVSTVWSLKMVDLTGYSGKKVRIGFKHAAVSGWSYAGWYIDDIQVIKFTPQFCGDFEGGWGDWSADNGVWEVGTPTAGPGGCHGGEKCAGTVLDGNYPDLTDSRLIMPSVTLPAVTGDEELKLKFWQWFVYQGGGHDYGVVQISVYDPEAAAWSEWTSLGTAATETSSVWSPKTVDLTGYSGKKVRIGFRHAAVSGWSYAGWYIDDVEFDPPLPDEPTPPTPPGAATLVSPSGAVCGNKPTYEWDPVSNATSYFLKVTDSVETHDVGWYTAAGAGCGSLSGKCSVTPDLALAAGAATWTIKTKNSAGEGPWSDNMAFSVGVTPGKATLTAPSGTISDATPTYTWNGVANTDEYRLLVKNSGGSTIIDSWYSASNAGCAGGSGTCSLTLSTPLAEGNYQWWIQTRNSSCEGPLSEAISFSVGVTPGKATLVSPSGIILIPVPPHCPTYTWNAVTGAADYLLVVKDSSGSTTIAESWHSASEAGCAGGSGSCYLQPSSELGVGSYQWLIQARNSSFEGPWSDPMSFSLVTVVPCQKPGTPVPNSPTGTVTTPMPTYYWSAVTGAGHYQLQVYDAGSSAGSPKIDKWYTALEVGCGGGTGICSINPGTELNVGPGGWKVRAANDCNNGDWSPWKEFTIQRAPPPTPEPISPPPNNTTMPTYCWYAAVGATWYHLWVNDTDAAPKIDRWYSASEAGCAGGAVTCCVTPSTELAEGWAAWWIQAWNAGGSSKWSAEMDFEVPAAPDPCKPALVSPHSSEQTNTPTYTWNACAGCSWYQLWVNDDRAANPAVSKWYPKAAVGCAEGTGTCSVNPAIFVKGEAKWWVQCWSLKGYQWSDGVAFSAPKNSGPIKPTAISPLGAFAGTTPAFTWQAVPSATWYRLWVNDSAGHNPVIDKWYTAAAAGCAGGAGVCNVAPHVTLSPGAATWWVQAWNPIEFSPWSDKADFDMTSP